MGAGWAALSTRGFLQGGREGLAPIRGFPGALPPGDVQPAPRSVRRKRRESALTAAHRQPVFPFSSLSFSSPKSLTGQRRPVEQARFHFLSTLNYTCLSGGAWGMREEIETKAAERNIPMGVRAPVNCPLKDLRVFSTHRHPPLAVEKPPRGKPRPRRGPEHTVVADEGLPLCARAGPQAGENGDGVEGGTDPLLEDGQRAPHRGREGGPAGPAQATKARVEEEADPRLGAAREGVEGPHAAHAVHALQIGQVRVVQPAVLQGLRPAQLHLHPREVLAIAHQLPGWTREAVTARLTLPPLAPKELSASPRAAFPASSFPLHPYHGLCTHTTLCLRAFAQAALLAWKDWLLPTPCSPNPSFLHALISPFPLPN